MRRPLFVFAVSMFSALLAGGFVLTAPCAHAQGTRLWTQSRMEQFEKGTPVGVSIGSDGNLRQGPGLARELTTSSNFVWAVAVDRAGRVFAGTGMPATVLRLAEKKDEKPFTLFATKDLSVQALSLGPDGALYAATLPSGKVYKLNPEAVAKQDESSATVVFDAARAESKAPEGKSASAGTGTGTEAHFIWALTFDRAGRLYIAAGNPAAIYGVDPAKPGAEPELFFQSDEAHIRALAWDAKGNLIAGSDGSGLVYRIDPAGKGYVLFEAPQREITSLAMDAGGTIYAACVGEKSRSSLPPLQVQGAGAVTIVQPESLQAVNASASVPEGTEIFALATGEAPRKLWTGKSEIVYALAATPGGLLALSGNQGRIFRIEDDGSFADLAHLQAQQGLSLAAAPNGAWIVGTGNAGKVYTLGTAGEHEFASDVLDAGAFARFGRVEIEPGSTGYALWTRTGNVEQPVRGWSEWQPLQEGAVASPPGRFLQWKAALQTGGELGGVGVNYLPVNSAPVVDELVVVPGSRLNPQSASPESQTVNIVFPSTNDGATTTFDGGSSASLQANKDKNSVTARWAAHDDDGDKLIYALYLRGDGETVWRLLKKSIHESAYSFDSASLPDGGYRVKVVVSDAPSHTPAEALTGEKVSDRFVIDTTPPAMTNLKAAELPPNCAQSACQRELAVSFDAEDATSPIAHAEYSLNAGPWQHIDPVGLLSDSRREHYEFRVEIGSSDNSVEQLLTVRATDRYDNVGAAKTVVSAGEK